MTLADISLPVEYEWAKHYALVFPAALAQRLADVQKAIGDSRYSLFPAPTTDGRYLCNADLLTECVEGGFLHAAFCMLDSSKFDQIEVLPRADAAALLPPDPTI